MTHKFNHHRTVRPQAEAEIAVLSELLKAYFRQHVAPLQPNANEWHCISNAMACLHNHAEIDWTAFAETVRDSRSVCNGESYWYDEGNYAHELEGHHTTDP